VSTLESIAQKRFDLLPQNATVDVSAGRRAKKPSSLWQAGSHPDAATLLRAPADTVYAGYALGPGSYGTPWRRT
jgi:hypothetical protein